MQKHKLDAIEEASVELISSPAVSYTFEIGNDDDNTFDEKALKITEMHTIDEVNGGTHDGPGVSSSSNSGNETTTSNSSEGGSDPFDMVFYQVRSASLPVPSKKDMKPFNTITDEKHRKTSSCGKLPGNYCYDCENSKINEKQNDHIGVLKTSIMNKDFNAETSLILNEANV